MAKTLLEVLSEQGIETHESGDKFVAHCPFHDGDREPSFTIYANNTYYCFGCNVWGNPVKFLIEFKGMTSKEALEYVGEDYEFPKAEKRAIKVRNMMKTGNFLYEVTMAYHKYLIDNPGPQKYLEDRGLTPETIDRFRLGYTDGAVLNLQFAYEYELANEVGLLNKSGGEALAHRITIPNIIEDKYVDFMIGRTVINDKIKYLGLRMPKPMCGFYDSRHSPVLFLVEGNFDYLVLRQWGYPAVVMSGSHITNTNYNLLRGKTIVVVPDNDEAGEQAANKIKSKLRDSYIIDYKDLGVKDIGELATKPGAKESFDKIVSEALWDIPSSKVEALTKLNPTLIDSTQLRLT